MNVLAIGAHPDDVEIGCGGTLIKHVQRGDHVTVLIVTSGEVGPGDTEVRHVEQRAAAQVMGVDKIVWGKLPDCKVSLFELELVHLIERVMNEMPSVDVIYTHEISDSHQDHRAVALGTLGAARHASTILCYDAPSAIEFTPTVFTDIDGYLDKKIDALLCHQSQVTASEMVSAERMRAQALVRGHQARVPYAEGFVPKRMVAWL
jgi:LmbE family N-acetylglucosaminyl deacetylase